MKRTALICLAIFGCCAFIVGGFYFVSGIRDASNATAHAASVPAVQAQPGWVKASAPLIGLEDEYLALQKKTDEESEEINKLPKVKEWANDMTLLKGKKYTILESLPKGYTVNLDTAYGYLIPVPQPAPADPALGAAEKQPSQKAAGSGSAVVNGNGNTVTTK